MKCHKCKKKKKRKPISTFNTLLMHSSGARRQNCFKGDIMTTNCAGKFPTTVQIYKSLICITNNTGIPIVSKKKMHHQKRCIFKPCCRKCFVLFNLFWSPGHQIQQLSQWPSASDTKALGFQLMPM